MGIVSITIRLNMNADSSITSLSTRDIAELNAGLRDTVAEERLRAFEVFRNTPFPSSKQEAWKYVDLDIDLDRYHLVADPGQGMSPGPIVGEFPDGTSTVVIRDGFLVEKSNSSEAIIESVADRTSQNDYWPGLVQPETDKFAAASAAFGHDGVSVRLPRGTTVGQPILIEVQTVTPRAISFPKLLLELDEDSEASVIVVFRSPASVDAVTIPGFSVSVGDGANLKCTVVQQFGGETTSVIHERVRVGRDAACKFGEVGLGGRFARLDLGVDLEGEGGSLSFDGLSFGEGKQTLDYRMLIRHIGAKTTSNVHLKGAVEDYARSVFHGLLRIEEGAARSSAFERNRNLVLSPGAKAHSVPNLEILCDDVVCGHGSSVGPLDEEHLYYLQTRGISKPRAERLLIRGFFSEVINRLPHPEVGNPVKAAVYRRFESAQTEGRIG